MKQNRQGNRDAPWVLCMCPPTWVTAWVTVQTEPALAYLAQARRQHTHIIIKCQSSCMPRLGHHWAPKQDPGLQLLQPPARPRPMQYCACGRVSSPKNIPAQPARTTRMYTPNPDKAASFGGTSRGHAMPACGRHPAPHPHPPPQRCAHTYIAGRQALPGTLARKLGMQTVMYAEGKGRLTLALP